ncbi:MAG: 6-phosphofructokinase, partial [Myxococcota bacterium]
MSTFGILVGGGPAPGINGVVGAAASAALRGGHRVIGIFEGFRHIMAGDTDQVVELDRAAVDQIHLKGGSVLYTSRANPTKAPETIANCVRSLDALGVDSLITIGGDDTASSAMRVAEAAQGRLRVVHVPKTVDNDLPLPTGIPTFGFVTAREQIGQQGLAILWIHALLRDGGRVVGEGRRSRLEIAQGAFDRVIGNLLGEPFPEERHRGPRRQMAKTPDQGGGQKDADHEYPKQRARDALGLSMGLAHPALRCRLQHGRAAGVSPTANRMQLVCAFALRLAPRTRPKPPRQAREGAAAALGQGPHGFARAACEYGIGHGSPRQAR